MSTNDLIKYFNKLEDYAWSKAVIPVKASTLASYFWCSRKSYIEFILENSPVDIERKLGENFELITTGDVEAARIGELIHGGSYGFHVTLLPTPPKDEVYRSAREGYVIPRNLETSIGEFQVQGAVDMIRPEDEGYTIRELKTTSRRSVPIYLLSPAEFQVQIYGWILSRYLPVKKLELIFMNQKTKEILRSYQVPFDEEAFNDVVKKYGPVSLTTTVVLNDLM